MYSQTWINDAYAQLKTEMYLSETSTLSIKPLVTLVSSSTTWDRKVQMSATI